MTEAPVQEAIVFEARGPYGLFRKPYAALSPISFATPPPTAILGMLGAILGYGKREYLERLGRAPFAVGVRLLAPVRAYRTGINLINTKDNPDFRLKHENPRMQIPFEFLRDPAYRLFISHGDAEVMRDLEERLAGRCPVYTPSLGLANCLAELEWVGRLPLARERCGGHARLTCVLPLDEHGPTVRYADGHRYLRYIVPSRMAPDRTVTRFQEVLHDAEGGPIQAEVGECHVCGEDRLLLY